VKPAAILSVFDKWRFIIATILQISIGTAPKQSAKAIRQSNPYDTAQELCIREAG
jgi:hypothetical protein